MRKTILVGFPLLALGALATASLYSTQVMAPGTEHKLSLCYHGNRVTTGLKPELTPMVLNIQWGPPYFKMGVKAVSLYGVSVGYAWNSAGVCEPENFDADAYMTQYAKDHPEEFDDADPGDRPDDVPEKPVKP